MKLKQISQIHSGYITRGKIETCADGTHYLIQAKDVIAEAVCLSGKADALARFIPSMSRNDRILKPGDLLFMARGSHNYSAEIREIPEPTLAAACFFIIRISVAEVMPAYLNWYLNQRPVQQYLFQNSGRGVPMPVVRRAVLENIEIPVPSWTIQETVAELNSCLAKETELLKKRLVKQKEWIGEVCLRAAHAGRESRGEGA